MDPRSGPGSRLAVGARIARERRARGWTQARLAEAVEIESSTLSRYECGVRVPPLHVVLDIARVLRVPLSTLLDVPEGPAPGTTGNVQVVAAPDVSGAHGPPDAGPEAVLALWERLDDAKRHVVLTVARALAD
jgi:DNA-binding XRE family transcriptional regulator